MIIVSEVDVLEWKHGLQIPQELIVCSMSSISVCSDQRKSEAIFDCHINDRVDWISSVLVSSTTGSQLRKKWRFNTSILCLNQHQQNNCSMVLPLDKHLQKIWQVTMLYMMKIQFSQNQESFSFVWSSMISSNSSDTKVSYPSIIDHIQSERRWPPRTPARTTKNYRIRLN